MTRKRWVLRGPLGWSLASALALSAWALWWPESEAPLSVVAAVAPAASQTTLQPPVGDGTLPEALPTLMLRPVDDFDPFAGPVAAPPPLPAPPVARPAPPLVQVAAPPPDPPPMTHRYLGRMADPDGAVRVYLAQGGDQPLPVTVGQTLSNGYVVKAITDTDVTLHYPPLDMAVMIPIPAQGEAGVR